MKKSRSKRIFGLLLSLVFALSLFVPNAANAAESSEKAEAGRYAITFNTSFSMCEVYYHIQNSDGSEISYGSVDELSTSVEGWKTYERDIWLEEAPATIYFSGRCYSSYPGSSGEIPVCLEDTEPVEFKECSNVMISNYSSILDTEYNWGSYSIKKVTNDDQSRVLSGDELDQTVIRMKPSFGTGKALSIATNGYSPVRQNVVHLYNIGDSSRFLLTKADEDSYYIDFYDGSGHYNVHEKRLDIDDANGYDNEGNKVHVVTGNRTDMNKRWQFIQRPNGYYLVRNKESGLYWALEDNSTKNGNDLVQKSLNNCHTWQMEILNCFDTSKKVNELKKYDTWSYKESADGSFNSCNWMSYLPDDMNITDISIPGSHDAGTAKTTTHLNSSAQCQQHTIWEQLNAGVRYFDIRIEKKTDGELCLTHGGIDCWLGDEHLKFTTVMDWVDRFLTENPSETVIFQMMVQKGGEKGERLTIDRMKNWDRVYRGENWQNPVMPELGDLRGKVMFISRFSKDGISQSTFRDGDKWFGLDAQNWKKGKDHTHERAVNSANYEIWTQDKYSMNGTDKMKWVKGSLFDSKTCAVARRADIRSRGKKGLIVSYTSCTVTDPQSAARYVHERMIPLLHSRSGQEDPFVGIVCNDFIDEELSWEIYNKNFRGINVTIRGMTPDGKTVANDLNYYFTSGTSVGNIFANEGNTKVAEHFTTGGYEPLCYGGGIPMYLNRRPDSFEGDWKAMTDAEVSMYSIPTYSGNYIFYVPLIEAGEDNATVTFDVHGHGSAPEPVVMKKGSWLFDVPVPAAEGYTFGGWYLDQECSQPFDESEPIYNNMTLYAKWTEGYTITVKVGFPGNIEMPESLSLTSYAHIPENVPSYVEEEITLNESNGWTGTFRLDPEESIHIRCKDELKYDWYLFTEKGEISLDVHGMSADGLEDYGNCIKLDFDDHEGSNPNWTDRQWKAAYDSVVNGTAEIRMIYSNHYSAMMTWDSGDIVNYTSCMYDAGDPFAGDPVIQDESDPWENIMLDQGEAHEVVLEHRETVSGGGTVWRTLEVGRIYDHERDGISAWTCAFDTPIVDKRENYRVRLKVNNRIERNYGSEYILTKEDGKEKLIYDAADEDAKGETNVFSFVFRDPRQDLQKIEERPGHRRTFKVTYGVDEQGCFTVHNERIGDFTAEIKWNLPGKYKSLKPDPDGEGLDVTLDGIQLNTIVLSEANGWYARFNGVQYENVNDARDQYRVMLGNSSDGKITLPVKDGEETRDAEFTVNYNTSDGYHYVVSLTLNHNHGEHLEHMAKIDATCTEAGNIEYWHCTDCDGYFADAEAKQEITKEETIVKAAGHKWGSWEVTTEPTEEQDGEETRKCENCDAVQTRMVAFEYDLRKVDEKPATCTEDGNIEYWVYDKTGKLFMDSSAQIEIQEDDVIIHALGHEWGDWNREAETVDGEIHHRDSRKCLRDDCGQEEVFEYAENHTHKLVLQEEIPATCCDTGVREHYMCTECGKLFEDAAGEIAIVDDGEDVPEADRKTAQEKLALPVDPDAHTWAECIVEKEPTCTEPGEGYYICLYDEAHYKTEEIEPLGHKWDAGKVTKEATTTQEGTRVHTCTVCGETKTETIPKLAKKTNPLKIKGRTATVKYSKLKKKTQTLAVTKVIKFTKDAKDKKTYTLSSVKKGSKSFKKYFKINKTTGKVTVKKGLKKGTYKVKVKVKALGNSYYKASGQKTVTFTIRVK